MPQFSAAMYPVGRMSERNSTCSSRKPFSILRGPTSAKGTRAYSACPPANPPSRCEYPKTPAGECPHAFSASHALGLEFSQSEVICRSQKKQLPQAIGNGTTTRSPGWRFLTPGPTSITSPINSCPRMSPFCIVGTNPLYKCRSEPQIAVDVILTIASRELRILGSGTVSTDTFRLPCQQFAFIFHLAISSSQVAPLRRPAGCPSVVMDSPVSTTCLKRRSCFRINWPGFLPRGEASRPITLSVLP